MMIYNPFSLQRYLHPRASGLITFEGGEAPAWATDPSSPEYKAREEAAARARAVAKKGAAQVAKEEAEKKRLEEEKKAKEEAEKKRIEEEEKKAKEARKAREKEDAARAKVIRDASYTAQKKAIEDPSSLVYKSEVAEIDANAGLIKEGTGTLTGDAPKVSAPKSKAAAKATASTVSDDVAKETDKLTAATGTVSDDAKVKAAGTDPTKLARLDLDVDQIEEAQVVKPAAKRKIESGELISGSAVDMAAVDEALDIQAAQADPSKQATVKGQLEGLMKDFEGEEAPAWAAGALRKATEALSARGLGASSMAGQAVVQAAMESALPIAMTDAETFSKFESQNLSNRQQTAMFAAEQRVNFLGMQFTQEFQTKVANAAKISDVANMNFTAEQQIALENANLAQTVDINNMNAVNAKVLADAAAMSQVDMANLNNRQQAAVTNAQSFLAMDMKNMDLQQQTDMFKTQQNIQALFTDQAAVNAASQFNAASENQTNQFFANLSNDVQKFNAGLEIQRDQFNATNALVVAQANAQWRQNTSTLNAAAQNQSNMQAAMTANTFTQSGLDQIWQRERDIMDYAFRQSENATDRALSVFLADKQVELAKWESAQETRRKNREGIGYLIGKIIG